MHAPSRLYNLTDLLQNLKISGDKRQRNICLIEGESNGFHALEIGPFDFRKET